MKNNEACAQPSSAPAAPSFWMFVLFPATAVLLGWGLRGYIGGGPFAAMIPGAFLALCFSLLLNHDREQAAIAALFGTVALGYGGEMTYGQTLGLACDPETMGWGLLGVTVKGAVWGLLAGAVLGAGLTRDQYRASALLKGLALTVVFTFIGWKLINEPKWIYFSNLADKPREELWAGLLFAALAFLAYMHGKGQSGRADIPLRFALWGAASGGIGFGGGTLFLVLGPRLPLPQEWFGWWKAMEFFFGFMLGAGLGCCAWRHRQRLQTTVPRDEDAPPDESFIPALGLLMLVALYFWAFPALESFLGAREGGGILIVAARNLFRPLYTFVFFGAACIALALRSTAAAWQVAIAITFFHTVVDLNKNWERSNGFAAPWLVQAAIMVLLVGAAVAITSRLRRRPTAVPTLYQFLLWLCYGMACIRSFVKRDYLMPLEGERGGLAAILEQHPGILPVHAVFTLSAIITALCIWKLTRNRGAAPPL